MISISELCDTFANVLPFAKQTKKKTVYNANRERQAPLKVTTRLELHFDTIC